MTDQRIRMVLSQAEIEHAIMDSSESLDELVHDYAEIAENAGVTEAVFKKEQAMMFLAMIEHPPRDADGKPRKMTVDERAARIEVQVNDKRREAAIAAARREHAREAMSSHRTRIDALRTLAANVRYLTTDRH